MDQFGRAGTAARVRLPGGVHSARPFYGGPDSPLGAVDRDRARTRGETKAGYDIMPHMKLLRLCVIGLRSFRRRHRGAQEARDLRWLQ